MERDESEAHLVHRLEAFSDIVIGFSLAMLTMQLALPVHAIDLFTKNSWPLYGFAFTFFFVSVFWWATHRLFTHFFVPTRLNIILIFMTLASILFFTYSVQLLIHSQMRDPIAYAMYTGMIGVVLLINAILTWQGLAMRGARIHPVLVMQARRRVLSGFLIAALLIPSALLYPASGLRNAAGITISLAVMGSVFVSRFVFRKPKEPRGEPGSL